jgi:hypothetical protein
MLGIERQTVVFRLLQRPPQFAFESLLQHQRKEVNGRCDPVSLMPPSVLDEVVDDSDRPDEDFRPRKPRCRTITQVLVFVLPSLIEANPGRLRPKGRSQPLDNPEWMRR